ncbi:unnamed protein product [Trifolium pratense]|uniref:Uncharacterized protein n=2 Tax=Trifolium pratense TaxID=57577 RepID=A0ACB0JK03_TRIPR|nr:unnamed protein product [Trifolium pratense]CAJ2643962.1 unnamed protein product [Trifolium pratense]
MSIIHYKMMRSYSLCYIGNEKKNMAKTLKLVSTIILVVFLFYIVEAQEMYKYTRTTTECISPKDCLDIALQALGQSDMLVARCKDGFCHAFEKNNEISIHLRN